MINVKKDVSATGVPNYESEATLRKERLHSSGLHGDWWVDRQSSMERVGKTNLTLRAFAGEAGRFSPVKRSTWSRRLAAIQDRTDGYRTAALASSQGHDFGVNDVPTAGHCRAANTTCTANPSGRLRRCKCYQGCGHSQRCKNCLQHFPDSSHNTRKGDRSCITRCIAIPARPACRTF